MLPGEGQWKQMPGKLKTIHCTDGNNIAGVSSEIGSNMYRWNGSGWTQLWGNGTHVHIGITWGNMWQVNTSDAICQASI